MSNAVATVAFLQGQAWAKAPDGSLRPLTVGSVLNDEEVLVTAKGSQVQLDFGNGEPVTINGGQEVAMSRDFNDTSATETDEALLDGASIDEALTVLAEGGDLLDELEETAAGNSGGGGSDGGNSFVRLTRILETTDPQSFNYESSSPADAAIIETDSGTSYVNRAPDVTDQALSGNEDEVITGQIIATDIDGDTITYTVVTGPSNGTLVLNPITGQFTFTPNANYNGSDSFVVTVTDSRGNSSSTTVSLTILPVNDAPTSSNVALTTNEDTPVPGQIVAVDVDGDTLAYAVTTNPANGTVVLNAVTGSFEYTPNPDFNGSDSFVVTISDGNGGTTTSTVTVGVTPVNDAPTAQNLSLTTSEDTMVPGQIVAADVDGDTLAYAVTTNPANGTVLLNPATGSFEYTPNPDFNGSDSFVVTISDGNGGTTTSTVTVGVTPVNDAPTAQNLSLTTNEDTMVPGQIVAADVDGDTLAYAVTTNPANGTVVLNPATGSFEYTPNPDFNGNDSFVVTISDDNGGTTTSTVTVGVAPVNDNPVAVDDVATVDEDSSVTIPVRINDTDIDGDTLTVSGVTQGANGSVVIDAVTGNPIYTPNAGFSGTDSFTYTIDDGNGGTATATVNVTVNPINHAPVAVEDTFTVAEGGTLTGAAANVLLNDTDVDGNTLTAILVTGPTNGTLTLNANGQFTYVHNGSETATDSFTYKVNDGTVDGNTVTVTINVTPVNDAPVTVADSIEVAEGGTVTVLVGGATSVLANDTDAENDPLTAVLVTGPTNGTLTLNADGTFSYTHNGSETRTDSFTYRANDGTANGNIVTVAINVTPVNDAPVAVADTIEVAEGGTVTVLVGGATSVLANDTDAEGDPLTAILVSGPTNGTLTLNADGTFSYVHNGSETTTDSFTYKVNDGTVDGNTVTVSINVTPVNDAPETNAVSASGNEDTLITITLSGSDVDGTVAGFVIETLPANGVLYSDALMTTQVSAGGFVTGPVYFMPGADWNGNTSFTYAARDNLGLKDPTPATVNITVNPVSDPAQFSGDDSGSVKEDTLEQSSATGTLIVVDPDAGESVIVAQTNVSGTYGSFSITAGGVWTYNIDNSKPAVQALKEGETKTETFTVASIDGTTKNVVITVTGTNDIPVAVGETASVNQDAVLTFTPAQLLANDTDIDGDTLSITEVGGATNGTVTLSGGNVVFTPNTGYHGPSSFTYTVSDGRATSTATVNVTVIKANTPPVAGDDSGVPTGASTGFHSEYFGYNEGTHGGNLTNIQQIYSFISGRTADATFTAKSFDYGEHFTTGNNLGYGTNLQNFLGSDAASLSADPATTTDAIIRMRGFVELGAGTYNFKVLGDDGYRILVDGVVVADRNQNQSATTTTHSQFTLATGGLHHVEIVYWDQGNYARLKVELSNDAGATYKLLSAIPNYLTVTFNATEDVPLNISASSLLANDTDADGDTLSITSVQGAVNGAVSLSGGNIVFTPTTNYAGPASFTYTVSDGKGGTSTATVNLVVTPVNDAPVAVADVLKTVGINQQQIVSFSTLLANDSDPEGSAITFVSAQDPMNGSIFLSATSVVFTPTPGYEGPASFTYTIRDELGATSTATVSFFVGSATTPSVVVSKSLVAVAHGTGGTSVKFPIITKLVDTDGSESLSIKVSNVPTGLSFNAGVNLGGGVWQFTEADLPNLVLNLPGSYTTNATHLTVQVTSTEINGGATASVSSVMTLKAAYTTVDITTTESGNYTGSSASEYIQGGNGNNTINAANGNNIINGGAGNDNLSAGSGSDIINGGSGNDTINAGSGSDRISGGSGNDTLIGGDAGENFVDVFVWALGDQGAAGTPAVDTIQNFATAAAGTNGVGGDVLDLRDLLQGESVGASNGAGNLANYLHFEISGGNTIIHISHTGGFTADLHNVGASYTSSEETQQIVLSGVNLQSLYSGATTDQQIITQLLNNNKLITD